MAILKALKGPEARHAKEIAAVINWAKQQRKKINKKAQEMIIAINKKYNKPINVQHFEELNG